MSLFEFLFERKNPGKVGSIKKNNQSIKQVNILILICKLIVSLLIIWGLFYITVMNNFNLYSIASFSIILFLYCYISYKYIPRPDTSNVGFLGGLIDNPFRYTDDLNRILILFLILLYPGRFISTTFLQLVLLLKKNRQKNR